MKQWTYLLSALLVLIACNDNAEKKITAADPEAQLKTAIGNYPDSALLKEKLVQFYRDNNNDSMAMATIDDAIKKDAAYDRWWDIKAQLYEAGNDTANSIRSWEKAAAIYPDPKYLLPLGYLYANLKNARAIIIADTLLNAYKPKYDKEALLIKGIYYNKSDKQKAIDFFDHALALSYTFMEAYREKAITLYELGKYDEAIKVLERATTVQSTYDEAWYWMGRCNEKLNKLNEAKENYQQAAEAAAKNNEEYPEAIEALDKLIAKLKTEHK